MSFMKPYIYGPQYGWRVETDYGTEYVPDDVVGYDVISISPDDSAWFDQVSDVLRDYAEGKIQSIEVIHGYFGRYSAPGYMDCTPWHFDTDEQTLRAELDEYYGDDESEVCECDTDHSQEEISRNACDECGKDLP